MSHATLWRAKLRDELLAARKNRDATRVSALRCALSAIDNAEAVPALPDRPSRGAIANAVAGLGAAEAARRELSDAEIRELLHGEIDERLAAARSVAATHPERATTLHAEAAVLAGFLGDV
jgi:uncharacterized protein YqeY